VKIYDEVEWLLFGAPSELALGAQLRRKGKDIGAFALLRPILTRMKHLNFPGPSIGVPDHG
jgi:hypothetical protein